MAQFLTPEDFAARFGSSMPTFKMERDDFRLIGDCDYWISRYGQGFCQARVQWDRVDDIFRVTYLFSDISTAMECRLRFG